jgi:hypothetical protein
MPFDHADSAIMNMISSIVIVLGLPLGFYLAFLTLNPIDHLKYASTEIGEGFMHGLQRGINETALNLLAKQLTHTVIIGATIVPDVQMIQTRFRHI